MLIVSPQRRWRWGERNLATGRTLGREQTAYMKEQTIMTLPYQQVPTGGGSSQQDKQDMRDDVRDRRQDHRDDVRDRKDDRRDKKD
jgi:hypothetical protein